MGEVELIKALTEHGGVIGFVLAMAVVLLGLWLRNQDAGSPKEGPAPKEPPKASTFDEQVAAIDRRLSRVEADIEHLPTRDEFHAVDRSMSEMRVQMQGIEKTTESTGHSVHRIENFLMSLGARNDAK